MSLRCLAGIVGLLVALGTPASGNVQTSTDTTAADSSLSTVLNDPFVRKAGRKGLNRLYNMRSEKAQALFQKINERYPNHPVGPFLQGLNLWWTIMLDLTDTSHDEAFFDKMDEVIERCDEILDENPNHFDALLFKGAAHGFKARLASNRGSWWRAIQNGRKAIGPARRVAEIAPKGNGDYVFGKGLYDYYTAILEEEYPAVKTFTWMIPDGSRKRGLRLLKRTAQTGHYVKTEAIYYLTQVHYLYEEDYRAARRYVRRLRRRHPDNPYFHNFEGRIHARWGRWDRAHKVFSEVVARAEAGRAGYNAHMESIAHYYLARERLYRGQYEEALAHLGRLDTLTTRDEDERFRILGVLYEGMVYDAMGQRRKAKQRYRAVLSMDDPVGVHDRAERYRSVPYSRS
ncbi:MAG: tetratricopeptide repeat protein [Salinibacter sp.]